MIPQEKLQQLRSLIDNAQTIALFWHKNIDGDALWSILWLWWVLEQLGKSVDYYTTVAPEPYLTFMWWIEKVQTELDYTKKYDLMFFLDFSPLSRVDAFTEWHEDYFAQQKIVVIDHHHGDVPDNTVLSLKDIDADSNCGWLYEIINELYPEYMNAAVATSLYLWVTTDTWNFMYEEQSSRTLSHALELVRLWAQKQLIIDKIFRSNSFESIQYVQKILSRLDKRWWVLFTRIDEADAVSQWLSRGIGEKSLGTIQTIDGADLVVLCKFPEDEK